jgi:hypothetical protein
MNSSGAVLVPEIHVGLLVARREVGEGTGPHQPARGGDVVALVDLVGFLPALGVGEGVVPLLRGEAHGLVAVGGVLQEGEDGADLRDG